MSEQSNATLIQRMYAAFNSGDIRTIVDNTAPEAEWLDFGPAAVPYCGNFTGRISDFFQAIGGSTVNSSVVIDRYFSSGETVITEGRFKATVRSTGAQIDSPVVHIFTLRNNKVTSWRGYSDTAAILAAHTGRAASA